jgi:predicted nucleic acid-binding protein
MTLVDTSVLIDYLKGIENEKSRMLDEMIRTGAEFGISPFTYQELLQGSRDEKEFLSLKTYLSEQYLYFLPMEAWVYEDAAKIYFEARRTGKTIRSAVDILIAMTAVYHHLVLLHNDKDFEAVADVLPDLKFE